jgi:hypothetical protein
MISSILFSLNRPTQLDLFLQSLFQNGNNLFGSIYILWKATTEEFEEGYHKCADYHFQTPILWNKEIDFRQQVNDILERCSYDYSCFFTDDNILYRKIDFSYDKIDDLFNYQKIDTLSLRLGRNTIYQNIYTKEGCQAPKLIRNYGQFIIWDIGDVIGYGNFNYPLSVDGHIFQTNKIRETILKTEFTNPNFLEGNLQQYHKEYPIMCCCQQNHVVNSPNNRVQSVFTNWNGAEYPRSPEELNQKFLEGYRINLNRMDFSRIVASHQELELPMEKL